jgi:hypothetical protein
MVTYRIKGTLPFFAVLAISHLNYLLSYQAFHLDSSILISEEPTSDLSARIHSLLNCLFALLSIQLGLCFVQVVEMVLFRDLTYIFTFFLQ